MSGMLFFIENSMNCFTSGLVSADFLLTYTKSGRESGRCPP